MGDISTSLTYSSLIPEIWEAREKTELITRSNFARLVSEYGLTSAHIGDVLHIPIIPQLSINSWSYLAYPTVEPIKKKATVVIVLNDEGEKNG